VFVTLEPWSERIAKGQEIDAVFAHVRPLFARSRARACSR
jgi:hypothetical protein